MKNLVLGQVVLLTLIGCLALATAFGQQLGRRVVSSKPESSPAPSPADNSTARAVSPAASAGSPGSADERAEIDAARVLAPTEKLEKLQAFVAAHPKSSLRKEVLELIVSTRAALGDLALQSGDVKAGVDQFRMALKDAPPEMSDDLFTAVISQLPLNLFVRGDRDDSRQLALAIEDRVKDNPKRLLALAETHLNIFYLGGPGADDAIRLSELAIKLAPGMAAAHEALGVADRVSLRLDEAAAEFARALELNPKSPGARRSLADLRRATGKPEEALALYNAQLKEDASDKFARTGMVLALFDLGRREEAEHELDAALKDEPRSLNLLVGAAYWYAAHDESGRALEMATRAVQIEPRYTWGYIALARALIAQKRPLEAESLLRSSRQYGQFPTLSYELANALAAAGLYNEAATELSHSFTLKGTDIETVLAGRIAGHAPSFIGLLSPERRAGIFQFGAADTESNARMLRGLLEFNAAVGRARAGQSVDEKEIVAAAESFVAGEDKMRAFRQLYVASRLIQARTAPGAALAFADAAMNGVDAALESAAPTVALLADEVRDLRAQAIAANAPFEVVDLDRARLSSLIRGRIEDLAGWALFTGEKHDEAIVRLRRAVSVLPENSPWWRDAEWHLGAALEASGKPQEALAAYIRGYNLEQGDPVKRVVIEALYRKLNGSLDGLDAKIGASSVPAEASAVSSAATPPKNDAAQTTPAEAAAPTPAIQTQAATAGAGTAQPAAVTATPAPEASAPPPPTAATVASPTQSPSVTASTAAVTTAAPTPAGATERPATGDGPGSTSSATAPAATTAAPTPGADAPAQAVSSTAQPVVVSMPDAPPLPITTASPVATPAATQPAGAAVASASPAVNGSGGAPAGTAGAIETPAAAATAGASPAAATATPAPGPDAPVQPVSNSPQPVVVSMPDAPPLPVATRSPAETAPATATPSPSTMAPPAAATSNTPATARQPAPATGTDANSGASATSAATGETPAPGTAAAAPAAKPGAEAAASPTPPNAAETSSKPLPTPSPAPAASPEPRSGPVNCTITAGETDLTLAPGGTTAVTINFTGFRVGDLAVANPNWADIVVFADPKSAVGPDAITYLIYSASKKPGVFTVSFKSPCGARNVKVTVK